MKIQYCSSCQGKTKKSTFSEDRLKVATFRLEVDYFVSTKIRIKSNYNLFSKVGTSLWMLVENPVALARADKN